MPLRAVFLAILSMSAACRGTTGPEPVPSPSPTPRPGGTLTGAYVLHLEPDPGCGAPAGPHSFLVTAQPADTDRSPAFQALDTTPTPGLELELRSLVTQVRGGIGTVPEGVRSREGTRVWVRAIGDGALSTLGAARGEVRDGRMTGYLAFAADGGAEGSLGSCYASGHRFTLRLP